MEGDWKINAWGKKRGKGRKKRKIGMKKENMKKVTKYLGKTMMNCDEKKKINGEWVEYKEIWENREKQGEQK